MNAKLKMSVWMAASLFSWIWLAQDAEAKSIHFGLALGGNYSHFSTLQSSSDGFTTTVSSVNVDGWGYTGSAGLSFFQDSVFGFRTALDFANLSMEKGGDYFQSKVLFASVIPSLNFNLFRNRHSLGIGAAYTQLFGPRGSRSVDKQGFFSLAIEGRDMWKVGKDKYFFLSAKIFGLDASANAADIATLFQLGFDF